VVAQAASADSAASLQATPDTGQVSEELLHRAIRSNVELAELLAGVVREVNKGLKAMLLGAERLAQEPEQQDRVATLGAIQREGARLQQVVSGLGTPGSGLSAPPAQPVPVAPAAAPRAVPPAAPAGEPPSPPRAAPAPAASALAAPTLESTLRDALAIARGALDVRGLKLEVRVAPGSPHPRCPSPGVSRAVAALLLSASAVSPAGSAAVLRCERKPVLLRGRNAEEIRREFLMLALAHGASLSATDQQRVLAGSDTGPLGEAWRLVREMGGFVRFAPLPTGLETRLFLPAQ
jgi:hypothetical protein